MEEIRLELQVPAAVESLSDVKKFIERGLKETDCPSGILNQIQVAVEEVFVNIARYAYAPHTGSAKILLTVTDAPPTVEITFIDRGIPYNPLDKSDPDLTLSVEKRPIGGLGIFLTKMTMDSITYAYEQQQNILTIRKKL